MKICGRKKQNGIGLEWKELVIRKQGQVLHLNPQETKLLYDFLSNGKALCYISYVNQGDYSAHDEIVLDELDAPNQNSINILMEGEKYDCNKDWALMVEENFKECEKSLDIKDKS